MGNCFLGRLQGRVSPRHGIGVIYWLWGQSSCTKGSFWVIPVNWLRISFAKDDIQAAWEKAQEVMGLPR